ncbi:PREDICTED: umecyanin-like [Nelumbo nucifera]|uniref:Phytocyanin domain-containing protein n=2 Tax=Nelumbo nucifera TaxID=4432 RepID=A0A822Y6C7_NELNU|nr:PREDICTED: umecyanin-like [Nelumbo nucifera]DAD27191.1 TPA_asm: hypothetical protein HUJ06_028659 [Nelumbo nucifera]
MARRMMGLLGCMLVVALFQSAAAQTTHTVGGSTGWTLPSSNSFYTTWASSQNFAVGDTLEFDFSGSHDVAQVTKANYDSCTKTPIGSIISTSPAEILLNASGDHYFICTISNHCQAGMKLAITVSAASTTTNGTTNSTTPTATSSPPPPSSASSLSVGGFSAVLLSIVIAFLH